VVKRELKGEKEEEDSAAWCKKVAGEIIIQGPVGGHIGANNAS